MGNPVNKINATILYVEDDAVARMAISLILKRNYPHLTLLSAGDGREGLEIFRTMRPAIVITDIVMPVMDGLQMAMEIKAIAADAQIIVTSACADAESIKAAINIDSGYYVSKPVKIDKLFAAIDCCMNRFMGGQRSPGYGLPE